MSKFIPKPKDRGSQFNSLKSTESKSASNSNIQQDESKQQSSRHSLVKRCRQGATHTINGLKRVSSTVVEQFTGPRQLHRRYWFWLGVGVGGGAIAFGVGAIALESSIP